MTEETTLRQRKSEKSLTIEEKEKPDVYKKAFSESPYVSLAIAHVVFLVFYILEAITTLVLWLFSYIASIKPWKTLISLTFISWDTGGWEVITIGGKCFNSNFMFFLVGIIVSISLAVSLVTISFFVSEKDVIDAKDSLKRLVRGGSAPLKRTTVPEASKTYFKVAGFAQTHDIHFFGRITSAIAFSIDVTIWFLFSGLSDAFGILGSIALVVLAVLTHTLYDAIEQKKIKWIFGATSMVFVLIIFVISLVFTIYYLSILTANNEPWSNIPIQYWLIIAVKVIQVAVLVILSIFEDVYLRQFRWMVEDIGFILNSHIGLLLTIIIASTSGVFGNAFTQNCTCYSQFPC